MISSQTLVLLGPSRSYKPDHRSISRLTALLPRRKKMIYGPLFPRAQRACRGTGFEDFGNLWTPRGIERALDAQRGMRAGASPTTHP